MFQKVFAFFVNNNNFPVQLFFVGITQYLVFMYEFSDQHNVRSVCHTVYIIHLYCTCTLLLTCHKIISVLPHGSHVRLSV